MDHLDIPRIILLLASVCWRLLQFLVNLQPLKSPPISQLQLQRFYCLALKHRLMHILSIHWQNPKWHPRFWWRIPCNLYILDIILHPMLVSILHTYQHLQDKFIRLPLQSTVSDWGLYTSEHGFSVGTSANRQWSFLSTTATIGTAKEERSQWRMEWRSSYCWSTPRF